MLTCNDCGRSIDDCDRHGCREVRGTAFGGKSGAAENGKCPACGSELMRLRSGLHCTKCSKYVASVEKRPLLEQLEDAEHDEVYRDE